MELIYFFFALLVTLNLKNTISPSSITYSFPLSKYLPPAFTAFYDPSSFKSSNFMTSAAMNPLSKSV